MSIFNQYFYIDNLAIIMICLIGFVGISVAGFSYRYLHGDSRKNAFYINLIFLVASVCMMVCSDNIVLIVIFWGSGNFFLTKLMLHKKNWRAARYSYYLALKNFFVGTVFMAIAMYLLYTATGSTSIQYILIQNISNPYLIFSCICLFLSAMTQSALWPFHKWLLSSLNSPTPVSSVMHAGLINGGGFILARFSTLYLDQPNFLNVIFIIGLITAMLGTLWKLMQSDIKRALACSTMGQMGFMIVQCGLGLFPAAIAHLCWHGLYKAYLFMASGAAAQGKKLDLEYPPSKLEFALALVCGLFGSYIFALACGVDITQGNSIDFLVAVVLISGAQFTIPILKNISFAKFTAAFIATGIAGIIYGKSVILVAAMMDSVVFSYPQPLSLIHYVGLFILVASWLCVLFKYTPGEFLQKSKWSLSAYVWMLNASQPSKKTITSYRNDYRF